MSRHKWASTDCFFKDKKNKVYKAFVCSKCGRHKLLQKDLKKGQWEYGKAWFGLIYPSFKGGEITLNRHAGECRRIQNTYGNENTYITYMPKNSRDMLYHGK